MADLDTGKLLLDISPDSASGPDLAYDEAYGALFRLAKGKPETQWSAAEEPNWRDVRQGCITLLQRCKDVPVAILLIQALLKTDGFDGFRAGLELLRDLLEKFWPTIHPVLDEDDGDATERLNAISILSPPPNSLGDTYQFRLTIRELPLASSRNGDVSLKDLNNVGKPAPEGAAPPLDEPTITAILTAAALQQLQSTHDSAVAAITALSAIEDILDAKLGVGRGLNLGDLRTLLSEIVSVTSAQIANRMMPAHSAGLAVVPAGQVLASGQQRTVSPASSAVGEIRCREDVVAAIDRICNYYTTSESSSPVPLLLMRARRLVHKNFTEIVRDLSPDALATLSMISGTDLTKAAE